MTDLNRSIAGMTCFAVLPSGPGVASPDNFAAVTYAQALRFLTQIDAARPPPTDAHDASLGMFDLKHHVGGVRFRCWSSTSHVEVELWQNSPQRRWIADVSLATARDVILACPALDAVFALLQSTACTFQQVDGAG